MNKEKNNFHQNGEIFESNRNNIFKKENLRPIVIISVICFMAFCSVLAFDFKNTLIHNISLKQSVTSSLSKTSVEFPNEPESSKENQIVIPTTPAKLEVENNQIVTDGITIPSDMIYNVDPTFKTVGYNTLTDAKKTTDTGEIIFDDSGMSKESSNSFYAAYTKIQAITGRVTNTTSLKSLKYEVSLGKLIIDCH